MSESSRLEIVVDGRSEVFESTDQVTVGRSSASSVRISDPAVSAHHARFIFQHDHWLLEDASSRNGTFVDGSAVVRHLISAETTVRFSDPVAGPSLLVRPVYDDDYTRPRMRETVLRAPVNPAISTENARGRLVVGRDATCDIVVDDLLVSRQHAHVYLLGDDTGRVVDLKSANGTFVDGRRALPELPIRAGHRVAVGNSVFRFTGSTLVPAERSGRSILDVSHLSVGAVGSRRLDDVSFTLPTHCLLAVIGGSGAGKSTLVKALTGTEPATSGRVQFDGVDLYRHFAEMRQRIGYVPQDDILHPKLTVEATLRYGAMLRFGAEVTDAERQERIDEVVLELRLEDRLHQPVSKLSGGQRKRVSVALELLTRPELLILDEPTSGLDPGNERNIMELLRDLADGGRTVIVVTHSMQSLHVCDRLLLLGYGGTPVFFGPPATLADRLGVEDLVDAFDVVNAVVDAAALRQPADAESSPPPPADVAGTPVRARPQTSPGMATALRHYRILTARYVAVLLADRRNLAILALQAPIIGLLMMMVFGSNHFAPNPTTGLSPSAGNVLMAFVLAAIYMGASNAVREVVKEREILRREQNFGLSIGAYLSSKVTVLGVLTAAQSAVLVALAMSRQNLPPHGVLVPFPLAEIFVAVLLCGLSAMCAGLLISTFVSSADKAMTLLPVLLFAEFLLAGVVFPVRPIGLQQVSWLFASRWGFAAVAGSTGFSQLRGCNGVASPLAERPVCSILWRGDANWWALDLLALVLLSVVALAVAHRLLLRRDPVVLLDRVARANANANANAKR